MEQDSYGPWAIIAGGSEGVGAALALKLAARYRTADTLGMPPFSMWYLPKAAGKRLVVLALGYLVAMFTRSPVLQTAGQLMYNVFFAVYGIQGLSYLNFVMKRRGTRRGLVERLRRTLGVEADVLGDGGAVWSRTPGTRLPPAPSGEVLVRVWPGREPVVDADRVREIVRAHSPVHVPCRVEILSGPPADEGR